MGKQSIDSRQRVIIFSGVFDPVHKGHLAVAEAAGAGDMVVFLPERVPVHKHGATAYEDRVNMLRIALGDLPIARVLESPFDRHTITETLPWLQTQFPSGQKFSLLFGADVLNWLPHWPDIDKLAHYGIDGLIIASRFAKPIEEMTMPDIDGVEVRVIHAGHDNAASTYIRQNMRMNADMLPAGVADYIRENELYISAES